MSSAVLIVVLIHYHYARPAIGFIQSTLFFKHSLVLYYYGAFDTWISYRNLFWNWIIVGLVFPQQIRLEATRKGIKLHMLLSVAKGKADLVLLEFLLLFLLMLDFVFLHALSTPTTVLPLNFFSYLPTNVYLSQPIYIIHLPIST